MKILRAKLIYLKDKQVFHSQNEVMRFVGKPIEIAKKLKEQGYELLHIIDLDANHGLETNFDVYDHLTYSMHVEVECNYEKFIGRLLKINARVVILLPNKIDLKKIICKKKLLVGKINVDFDGEVDSINDLLIENATLEVVKKFHKIKKRISVYKKDFTKDMEKMIFAVIE